MSQQLMSFTIAPKGYSTFPEADITPDMCLQFKNMFTNIVGNAEKRQGPIQLGQTVPTKVPIDGTHEFITPNLKTLFFATGQGQIWLQNSDGSWTNVYTFADVTARIFSMSMNQKMIFYNGSNRNVYTTDGVTFSSLLSLLRVGTTSGSEVSANGISDTTITNWTTVDGVSQFSIVYFPKTSSAGMITSLNSATVSMTAVSAGGLGIGVGPEPSAGIYYQIRDTEQVNIIPVSGIPNLLDNKENAASGTNATTIKYSAVADFTATEVRIDDWIYNSAKNSLSQVTSITTSSLGCVAVSGQGVNNKIYLLKSSQPITYHGVVHYSRSYNIDARNRTTLRISGPNDPQDFGSSNAATLFIADYASDSDRLTSLASFQRFFIMGTSKKIHIWAGTDPVGAATVSATVDWQIQGRFPFGVLSRQGITGVGNDIHVVSVNGVRNLTLSKVSQQFLDNTSSWQIDRTLRTLLKNASPEDIQMFYYQKRSWVGLKVGTELFIYNFVTQKEHVKSLTDIYYNTEAFDPAWHKFDGTFAQAQSYLVREDGNLITGHNGGIVGIFDQGNFSDFGNPIQTVFESAWLAWENGKASLKGITRKHGNAIKSVMQIGSNIDVVISVEAPYNKVSSDSLTITTNPTPDIIGEAIIGQAIIGGNSIDFTKFPLRWRGEVAKFKFETNSVNGPFVLSNFVIFYNQGAPE